MKTTSVEHGQNMGRTCACSFHGDYMNNLLSYCGLIDAKIRASDKDLPVGSHFCHFDQKIGLNGHYQEEAKYSNL